MPRRWSAALVAVAVCLALAGCAEAEGVPIPACAADFSPVVSGVPAGFTMRPRLAEISCWRESGDRRIELGFSMPAGPDCYAIDRVELVESPEAIGASLFVGVQTGPLPGACPEEELPWTVEVHLRDPVGDRPILDASRTAD